MHSAAAYLPASQLEHGEQTVQPTPSLKVLPASQSSHVLSFPWGAYVPAKHGLHSYSSFERVASTPQFPVRTEPGAHCRLRH